MGKTKCSCCGEILLEDDFFVENQYKDEILCKNCNDQKTVLIDEISGLFLEQIKEIYKKFC